MQPELKELKNKAKQKLKYNHVLQTIIIINNY